MSYKRGGRAGIIDDKKNDVGDKFLYLLNYLEEKNDWVICYEMHEKWQNSF